MQHRMYIDGRWSEGSGDSELTVINPATEEELARVPQASLADAEEAILAARRAFDEGPWGRTT
ncbi:MAG: aldehyde dehydrogenase family protein, partial [Candidatus Binatia bacterium]